MIAYFKRLIRFIKRHIKSFKRSSFFVPHLILFPVVLIIRLLNPWILIRFSEMREERIGHFAGNIEMFLCEYNSGLHKPLKRHINLFFLDKNRVSNKQVEIMWRRILRIIPSTFGRPIYQINRFLCKRSSYNFSSSDNNRDTHNLLYEHSPHLNFTDSEIIKGEKYLRQMGIPLNSKIVCLLVRDSEYLDTTNPGHDWSYHNYRDSNISNYILCAEELANYGYYVVRMGAHVKSPLISKNPKIIDYATNGMRSDFMDVYLGYKCDYCISNSSGWDDLPKILFRKPIVLVNFVPIAFFTTYLKNCLIIFKHHYSITTGKKLTLTEIFKLNASHYYQTDDFLMNQINLVENSPNEICDVAFEMVKLLESRLKISKDEILLQNKFWDIYLSQLNYKKRYVHNLNRTNIHSKISYSFIKNNINYVQ
jgi:putative glycosyltransferase (TIGR04372 family)